MCGWTPVCKSFVREVALVACSHVSGLLVRYRRPLALMGSANRVLISLPGLASP